jgi:hypothetical protein
MKTKLHYNTISPLLHDTLKTLMAAREFNAFRLVGGTALSLQRGHRKSDDIDLFTAAFHGTIDFEAIDSFLRDKFPYVDTLNIKIVGFGRSYTIGKSKDESVKLDLYYTDEFIQEAMVVDGIRLATIEEIIAMKMDVISRVGRKKDFWDIHELIKEYSLKQMIELHKKRYEYTHDAGLIKRNMENFSKADGDFDPVCLRGKKWGLIKLDIIDFSWADSPSIVKEEHKFISLEANVPFRIRIEGGIDYMNTLLYFSYDPELRNKQVRLTVKNNSGEKYSIPPVHFDNTGRTSFPLESEPSDMITDYTFYYLEFMSNEEIKFEFWTKDEEGGFMDF